MRNIAGRKNLTSKEAARLLGVSEASVKRWADGGLLPTLKTAGGHRRFRPEDVAAFRRGGLAGETAAASNKGGSHERPEVARASQYEATFDEALPRLLFESMVGGHDEETAAMLVNLYLQGHTVARIADVVLCPALRMTGDLWQAGELSVAQEHLATRTALSALQTLRTSLDARKRASGRSAICCSVEDDFHELPVHLAVLTLEAQGWGIVNLGTSTPFYALSEAVARFDPQLVCVASTVFNHPDRAAREYGEFSTASRRAGASVVLGGVGFQSESVRRRFPANLHAETFFQLECHASALDT
ncbi:MAG: helix-turn-helix domain-containing protein, partial [Acidobacteria bacterium]|nr:helix-turn-helix domain-containing protein [Acidobacteriota bacterium]